MNKNKLILIVGPSGSGKTTVARAVMDNELVSFTTRSPRVREVNNVDYIFISLDEFEYLLNNNGLIESTCYNKNYYGLTRKELESKLALGNAFAIVDIHGMRQLKEMYENSESIFIYTERDEVEKRMRLRGDSEENIKQRLSTFETEKLNMVYCDWVVENNGNIEEAIESIKAIVGG